MNADKTGSYNEMKKFVKNCCLVMLTEGISPNTDAGNIIRSCIYCGSRFLSLAILFEFKWKSVI